MNSRTKNGLLIAAIVLVLILCYKFAITNTLELRKEYKGLAQEEVIFKNTPKQLTELHTKQREYDAILSDMNLGNSSVENNLLRVLNLAAEKHKLKVIDFNRPHKYIQDENTINTFDFTLEGSYSNLLQTIHTLEQKNNFGEIVHLQFLKKKDYRTNRNRLSARIFIRYLE